MSAALFVSVGAAVALTPACSSSNNNNAAPAPCDDSKCKVNNHCISTAATTGSAGDTKCRFACTHHTDCPLGYHCDANEGGSEPYCTADNYPTNPSSLGLWGAPCQANLTDPKTLQNPACDASQGFLCHATSPTDGSAFCTFYGCAEDGDCGGGFYCATIDEYPNATNVARDKDQKKHTTTACLPRDYCAPCQTDIDCGPSSTGAPQHCVGDKTGTAPFCAPECTTDTNCHSDARCADYTAFKACTPRAGECKGDGSLCSPCRSDADCPNGFCAQADYSSEKFCTVTSGKKCSVDTASNTLVADCPKTTVAAGTSCTYPAASQGLPSNQCIGLIYKGAGADRGLVMGCWSKF